MHSYSTPPANLLEHISIQAPDPSLAADLQEKINAKTKPLGALGQLETLALKIGLVQQSLSPSIQKPALLLFAGDHGLATEGVSPYPQEVTTQMVLNFLGGGAAINVFARQHNLPLQVVDAGVKEDLPHHPLLINSKIGHSTANMRQKAAMTAAQCAEALQEGSRLVKTLQASGCNCLLLGEMGIGNTSAAALLMSYFCGLPLPDCTGAGTGLDGPGQQRKCEILQEVQSLHEPKVQTPFDALQHWGGFEIAMLCGAMLEAARLKMLILVDGFICTAALLPAFASQPAILDYCIFSHLSNESGHRKMLNHLGASPLLQLDLRLGEGTGAALAFPLVQAAANFLNEMASFSSAGVSQKQ